MDQRPLYNKYTVTRNDGKPVGSCFVIEDKDPQYAELMAAISAVYVLTRPELSYSLRLQAVAAVKKLSLDNEGQS